jgi:hypothetical protein
LVKYQLVREVRQIILRRIDRDWRWLGRDHKKFERQSGLLEWERYPEVARGGEYFLGWKESVWRSRGRICGGDVFRDTRVFNFENSAKVSGAWVDGD